MKNTKIFFFLVLIITPLLSGCAIAEKTSTITPDTYLGLLYRSKHFLSICILISQNYQCKYYAIFSYLYYSYLSLHRVKFIYNKKSDPDKALHSTHEEYWQLSKKLFKTEYGKVLRDYRNQADYDVDYPLKEQHLIIEDLLQFINSNDEIKAFDCLIEQTKEIIDKLYKEDKPRKDLAIQLIEDIKKLKADLIIKINKYQDNS